MSILGIVAQPRILVLLKTLGGVRPHFAKGNPVSVFRLHR
jgi:hypothetical protein